MGHRVLIQEDEKVLEVDDHNDCMTMSVHVMHQ